MESNATTQLGQAKMKPGATITALMDLDESANVMLIGKVNGKLVCGTTGDKYWCIETVYSVSHKAKFLIKVK